MGKSRERALDFAEQIVVALLFAWLCARLWPANFSSDYSWCRILFLVSEAIVVAFVILRRPTEMISFSISDWFIAFAGTFCSLLVVPGGPPFLASAGALGALLLIAGILLQLGAKLSLRRSFGLVAADRGVKATGLYAFVRHPMYLGYILFGIGYLLIAPCWWNLAVYAVGWTCLALRIFAEERILRGNSDYIAYTVQVPYRLIPFVF